MAGILLDYSKLTYDEIVSQLTAFLEGKSSWKNLTNLSPSIEYIQVDAALTELLIYLLERRVEELYPGTAKLKSSVMLLAQALNYNPRRKTAAQTNLKFTLIDSITKLPVPAPSTFNISPYWRVKSATSEIEVVTAQGITFNIGDSEKEVLAYQGEIDETNSFSSNGSPLQRFSIVKENIDHEFVFVNVDAVPYTVGLTLAESLSNDEHVSVRSLIDYKGISLSFGDNINGKIPPIGTNNITTVLLVTDGKEGNVNILDNLTEILSKEAIGLPAGTDLLVTNTTQLSGGADEETVDSIRENAPKVFVVSDRTMVSKNNWINQLGRFPGIKQLNVAGEFDISPESPNIELANVVHIRILGELDENDNVSKVREINGDLTQFGTNIQNYVNKFKDLSVKTDIQDAVIVPIIITVDATIPRDKNAGIAKNKIDQTLNDNINFDELSVGERLNISDVYTDITNNVPEVDFSHILFRIYDEVFTQILGQTQYNFSTKLKDIRPLTLEVYLGNLLVAKDDGVGNITPEIFTPVTNPVAGPTLVETTGGGLDLLATYEYKYRYIVDGVAYTLASPLSSHTLTGSNNQIDLSNIVASADPRVTGIEIYRTEGGGASFRYLDTISNGTTVYNDIKADGSLGAVLVDNNNTAQYVISGLINYSTGLGDIIFNAVNQDDLVYFLYEQTFLGDIAPEYNQILSIRSKEIEIIFRTV